MLYNALSARKKTHKLPNCSEDRATARGNMRTKFGKYRARSSGDMLANRQTDRQTCSLQQFATAAAGDVIMNACSVSHTVS